MSDYYYVEVEHTETALVEVQAESKQDAVAKVEAMTQRQIAKLAAGDWNPIGEILVGNAITEEELLGPEPLGARIEDTKPL